MPHVAVQMRRAPAVAAGILLLLATIGAQPQHGGSAGTPDVDPRALGFDPARLARIDQLVEDALGAGRLPGAVVVVGRRGGVVYRKAFGHRALVPAREPMTLDTIFDAASLTKVVATTPSVMRLVEEGRLRLTDRVSSHILEFARYGKRDITIRHLLTHTSGLRPDLDLADPWSGAATAIRLATEEVPVARPDERFIYSDINFVLLGEIVARVSGTPLDRFAATELFAPLAMTDTMFLPPESLRARVAPTEGCTPLGWPCGGAGAVPLRGTVHDPTARRMGGVAGHAGVFTTAADLTRFARMLLGGGALEDVRVLAPLTVARMTSPSTPPGLVEVRGLGWDLDSPFSANRGELLPPGSYGHTGFTGTGLWVDPATGTFVVFLSSRLHPDGKGDVTDLRARVATAAAAALVDAAAPSNTGRWGGRALGPSGNPAGAMPPPPSDAGVLTGIDVLRAERFSRLRGRRVGLLTNQTGRARDGESTIDLLFAAADLKLVALFSPEHGIRGTLDDKVLSSVDPKTGLTVHSLYGEARRPTPEMLEGVDTMVIDLQDVGARFYTYATAMAYVMEEARKRHVKVVVLDRPNPIDGWRIEGPSLDADAAGYTGYFPPVPTRHAMTLGELARLFNEERGIGAELEVVAMRGWSRDQWFDQTGLTWVNPSPNLRTMNAAVLYPGVGGIEWANLSVGRGTDTPFEQVGAPWIDGVALAAALNARALPGVRFYPVTFTPSSGTYAGERCRGVFLIVTDREALRPVRVGLEIVAALATLHGQQLDAGNTARLLGSREAIERVIRGEDPEAVSASWSATEARWRLTRAKYLLY